MAYFVKWKGYPDSENSWVKESDAPYVSTAFPWLGTNNFDLFRHADELISKFMDKRAKEKIVEKKKASVKPRRTSERPQEPKKRGRVSTKSKVDSDDEEPERSPVQPTRKQRKSTTSAKHKEDDENEEIDMGQFKPMSKYMHLDSWNDLVAEVETIEKDEGGKLYLYGKL